MEVLQVFESYGCLYVHEEYPQRDSGQADTPLWKAKRRFLWESITALSNPFLYREHVISKHKHLWEFGPIVFMYLNSDTFSSLYCEAASAINTLVAYYGCECHWKETAELKEHSQNASLPSPAGIGISIWHLVFGPHEWDATKSRVTSNSHWAAHLRTPCPILRSHSSVNTVTWLCAWW